MNEVQKIIDYWRGGRYVTKVALPDNSGTGEIRVYGGTLVMLIIKGDTIPVVPKFTSEFDQSYINGALREFNLLTHEDNEYVSYLDRYIITTKDNMVYNVTKLGMK
ncbi:MAG: hypothetical protein ACRC92_26515 [Peptostreptococcaceae bacterium]